MKKLLNSLGVRVLAFALCLVFTLGTVVCAGCYLYNYFEPDQTEGGREGFLGNGLAWSYANQDMWGVLETYVRSLEYDGGPYIQTPSEGVSFIIMDPEGEIVADTRTENACAVGDGGQYWSVKGYTARAFLELPARRGSPLDACVRLYDFLYNNRSFFFPVGAALGVLALATFVFLMAAAGRTPEGVSLRGFHSWPLEIYAGGLAAAAVPLAYMADELSYGSMIREIPMYAMLYGAIGLGLVTLALLLCMDLAARFKVKGWWRNTVTFFCLKWTWRLIKWIWRTFTTVCRGLGKLITAAPLAWKAVLVYGGFLILNGCLVIAAVNMRWQGEFFLFLLFVLDFAGLLAVVWVSIQLKKLQAAGRAMAAGDLSYTVDVNRMLPALREHGENLNAISQGMTRAVNERMKSERFKTELITNVSHDLKTPLTSIVNYVDLLKKEPAGSDAAREYIEVLDRQSQRLKKLTTDLVDASKASSGVLTVNAENVDLPELLRQAAGEYAERFALAGLEPVLGLPGESVSVRADGRLLWRVLDNLLTNVVKYALPGTRVYLDLGREEGRAVLSVKNISRDPLNIPAEELMERFVRGDASRSTDGSGLGLSIARSLMELMGGSLELVLDGDLFKAKLIFPG